MVESRKAKNSTKRQKRQKGLKDLFVDIVFLTAVIVAILGIFYNILFKNTFHDFTPPKTNDDKSGGGSVNTDRATQIPYIYYIIGFLALVTILGVFVYPLIRKRLNKNGEAVESELGLEGIKLQERILKKNSHEWGNETSLILAAEALERRIVVVSQHPLTLEYRTIEYGNPQHKQLRLSHQPVGGYLTGKYDPHVDWIEEKEPEHFKLEPEEQFTLIDEEVEEEERRWLQEYNEANHYNFIDDEGNIITVKGDGKCMFRALAKGVYNDENRMEDIRKTMRDKFPTSNARKVLAEFGL